MSLKTECSDCGEMFVDEHSHGYCFSCKIHSGGITLGHVPNHDGVSRFQMERNEVAAIRATGQEPVRLTGNETDKRETRKPYVAPRRFQKWLDQDAAKITDADKKFRVTHDDSAAQRAEIAKVLERRA